jgi:hypothetical protein
MSSRGHGGQNFGMFLFVPVQPSAERPSPRRNRYCVAISEFL